MKESFGNFKTSNSHEKPRALTESIEQATVREEVVDESTLRKIAEADRTRELVTFLNDRLNDPDEKVLYEMQLAEFLKVLNREREDFEREGKTDLAAERGAIIKDFKDSLFLHNGLSLDDARTVLSLHWTELNSEIEKKLGHKI